MAKKDFGSQDDPISGGSDKATSAGLPSLQEVDAHVFGNGVIPDSGQQVARPILLEQISPDPTQPRREVPSVVRNRARENGLPEWEMWHQMASRQLGSEIPLKALLRGEGDGSETEKTGMPLVDGFMSLVALAASIHEKGLVNPITVSPRGMDHYMIETGERRYQAYLLLYGVLGHKKYSKIVANKVPTVDVWRQASENGSRKPLNAIGMARQIALLIMALNEDKTYEPFEAYAGQCDRLFYAQVADGNTHRIPKGSSEKILQATGLKSRTQIAQYRALLDVSDDVWQQADEDDWTENRIRETVRPASHTLTAVNVSAQNHDPIQPPMSIKKGQGPGTPATGDKVLYHGEVVEYLDSIARADKSGLDVLIYHIDANGNRTIPRTVHSRDLRDMPHPERGLNTGGFPRFDQMERKEPSWPQSRPMPAPQPEQQPPAPQMPLIVPGNTYKTKADRYMKVIKLVGDMAICEEVRKDGSKMSGATFQILLKDMAKLDLVPTGVSDQPAIAEDETDTDLRVGDTVKWGDDPLIWTVTAILGSLASVEAYDGDKKITHSMQPARYLTRITNAPFVTDEAVDNPSSIKPDVDPNEPPEWAARGNDILHLHTNTIYRVIGTIRDDVEDQWYVRVQVGPGNWNNLLVSECEEYIEPIEQPASVPYTPHPALKNLEGVITEDQRKIAHIASLAGMMGNKEDEAKLRGVAVMVSRHLLSWINTDGLAATEAHLIDIRMTAGRTLEQAWNIIQDQIEEAIIIARAIDEDHKHKTRAS